MPTEPRKSDWNQVGENLVRHRNGTIYLRAKVAGKIVRRSLRVTDLRIAKLKRDDLLDRMRKQAGATGAGNTIGDVLAALKAKLSDRPNIRQRTRDYNAELFRVMAATLPVGTHGAAWSAADAAAWWRLITGRYSASVANKIHAHARKLGTSLIARGLRLDDPTAGLGLMRQTRAKRDMPSLAQMQAIISAIATNRKASAVASSRMVAVMAFSGMRAGEVRRIRWADVGADWLTVGADGRTKGGSFRMVPISEPLRAVLADMRADNRAGKLFEIETPRGALTTACAKLGLPHMRLHDLRHFFTTWAIESGVDIPTVAKWLGHKDGGALLMRTYSHVRDDHSLAAARLLK